MSEHKSLVHVLEDVVLALEAAGETEQEIHSMVAMILRGFIRDGELTAEYKVLAQQAMAMREGHTQRPVLADAKGRPLVG